MGVSNQNLAYYYDKRYALNYSEVYAGVIGDHLSAHLHYSPNYLRPGWKSLYAEVDGSIKPADNWRLFAHLGTTAPVAATDGRRQRYDARVGVARRLGPFEVQASVVATTPDPLASSLHEVRSVYHVHSVFSHDACDANGLPVALDDGFHPKRSSALLGDPKHPDAVFGANGGTDVIWLPGKDPAGLARRIVAFLTTQDYTGAIFVRDDLGPIPGALPTSAINFAGAARTPAPAILVSFRSWSTGCADPYTCAVEVADNELQQGQGIHGAFGREDTHNFMAAIGPDFKKGFLDPAPVSNADLAITLAKILRLDIAPRGVNLGRVLSESLKGGAPVTSTARTIRSAPAANGFVTVLNAQAVGPTPYFDAAGAPGRTLGLKP